MQRTSGGSTQLTPTAGAASASCPPPPASPSTQRPSPPASSTPAPHPPEPPTQPAHLGGHAVQRHDALVAAVAHQGSLAPDCRGVGHLDHLHPPPARPLAHPVREALNLCQQVTPPISEFPMCPPTAYLDCNLFPVEFASVDDAGRRAAAAQNSKAAIFLLQKLQAVIGGRGAQAGTLHQFVRETWTPSIQAPLWFRPGTAAPINSPSSSSWRAAETQQPPAPAAWAAASPHRRPPAGGPTAACRGTAGGGRALGRGLGGGASAGRARPAARPAARSQSRRCAACPAGQRRCCRRCRRHRCCLYACAAIPPRRLPLQAEQAVKVDPPLQSQS